MDGRRMVVWVDWVVQPRRLVARDRVSHSLRPVGARMGAAWDGTDAARRGAVHYESCVVRIWSESERSLIESLGWRRQSGAPIPIKVGP
jgi:hypothetical protein